ncbi:MAG: DUF4349 domain-containing protein [Phycisphaerae bacterium]|nr:DUF4349 domain-containing protein [Phycisphaerae bacterium]
MIRQITRQGQGVFSIGLLAITALTTLTGCMSVHPRVESSRSRGFSDVDRAAAGAPAANSPIERFTPARIAEGLPEAEAMPSVRLVSHQQDTPALPAEDRIVIYNAGLRIVVKEIEESIKQTEALAAELGGWVQEIRGETITIRVPVANYQKATARVEGLGRVVHRELEAADVTEEYVDLQARLKNAMAVRDRLQALLERAEDVKAALEVEKELKRIGEEIERLQAKLGLIKNRVAYSTITVTFERVYRTVPTPQLMKLPFGWLRELDPNRLTAAN